MAFKIKIKKITRKDKKVRLFLKKHAEFWNGFFTGDNYIPKLWRK